MPSRVRRTNKGLDALAQPIGRTPNPMVSPCQMALCAMAETAKCVDAQPDKFGRLLPKGTPLIYGSKAIGNLRQISGIWVAYTSPI